MCVRVRHCSSKNALKQHAGFDIFEPKYFESLPYLPAVCVAFCSSHAQVAATHVDLFAVATHTHFCYHSLCCQWVLCVVEVEGSVCVCVCVCLVVHMTYVRT